MTLARLLPFRVQVIDVVAADTPLVAVDVWCAARETRHLGATAEVGAHARA